jgi:decaprenylphospho-beta-D-erythro-pentofuranosid-2-ulose 2-reductase
MTQQNNSRGLRIVIIGASSGIAEHCARQWALLGARSLYLLGRDLHKLQLIADDLHVRNPAVEIVCDMADFTDPAAIQSKSTAIYEQINPDIVLIAHGSLPDQQACQTSLEQVAQAIAINASSPVLFAEAFIGQMERAGQGTLVLLGSVAGDRGRRSNYVYGAAKGLVTRYAQGLQHRLAGSRVKVVLVKPGPTDTAMTSHLKAQGARLADPAQVAAIIIKAIQRGTPVVYAPARWALIMMVIRHLPRLIFNRMDI